MPNLELGKYGIGVYLFFDFMKFLIIAFTAMSIISLPILYLNIKDMGLSGIESRVYIERTMIANVERFPLDPYKFKSFDFSNLRASHKYYQILDLLNCIVFFALWAFYRFSFKKKVKKVMALHPAPNYFAVQLYNLPEDTTWSELRDNFKSDNSIIQITIGRYYEGLIKLLDRIYEVDTQIRLIDEQSDNPFGDVHRGKRYFIELE